MLLALWYHSILATLFAVLAVLLMGVILLQRGKGVGLSGAFGGAGGHTAFGAKTGDVLTWATIVIAAVLLVFAVILNYVFVAVAAPTAATPTVAPLSIPEGAPPAAPAGSTGQPAAPSDGETATPSAEPVPAETPPPTETEQPAETPPGGGGDAPGWPDVFGADPE
jgi:preprotein translocase subunit SecG